MLALLILYQLLFPILGIGIVVRFLLGGRGRTLLESAGQLRQRLGLLNSEELGRLGVLADAARGADAGAGAGHERVLWMHAASVGEVNAAAALLRELAKIGGRPRILFTASTAAGRERAAGLEGVDLAALAPMDFYPSVSAFLKRARPRSLVLVETELWPVTLYLSRRRGLRIALVNGRLSPRSFGRYRVIRVLLKPILEGIERAAVQTAGDADRFKELGVREAGLRALGNLKLDVPGATEEERRRSAELMARLGWADGPVWIAGSTRPGEEEAVLEAHRTARVRHPGLRLVLAPRHVERAGEIATLLDRSGVRWSAYSELSTPGTAGGEYSLPAASTASPRSNASTDPDCLLLDRLGFLRGFYAAGIAAFVGGTLADVGGHNLLEPAMASVPVLFGPYTDSVAESAEALRASGGGIRVEDSKGLARELDRLLADPRRRKEAGHRARAAADRLAGAARRTLEFIAPVVEIAPPPPLRPAREKSGR